MTEQERAALVRMARHEVTKIVPPSSWTAVARTRAAYQTGDVLLAGILLALLEPSDPTPPTTPPTTPTLPPDTPR